MPKGTPSLNTNYCVRNIASTTNVRQGGETWKRRCACKSWMNHWRAGLLLSYPNARPETYLDPPCYVRGCSGRGRVGAHVVEIDGRAAQNWKIIPFCAAHNHHTFEEDVFLTIDAILISAGQVDTCLDNEEWRAALKVVKTHQGGDVADPEA